MNKTSKDGWTIFAPTEDKANFFLCLNGEQVLNVAGIPLKIAYDGPGAYLIIDVATPKTVPPWKSWSDATTGWDAKKGAMVLKAGGVQFDLGDSWEYVVPAANLAKEKISAALEKSSSAGWPLDYIAWAKSSIDLGNPKQAMQTTVKVYFGDARGNASSSAGRVQWALERFARKDSTLTPKDKERILSYAEEQAKSHASDLKDDAAFSLGLYRLPKEGAGFADCQEVFWLEGGDGKLYYNPKVGGLETQAQHWAHIKAKQAASDSRSGQK